MKMKVVVILMSIFLLSSCGLSGNMEEVMESAVANQSSVSDKWNQPDSSNENYEVLVVTKDNDNLDLLGNVKLSDGEITIKIANHETKETIWENSFTENADIKIPLGSVIVGEKFILDIKVENSSRGEYNINLDKNYIEFDLKDAINDSVNSST